MVGFILVEGIWFWWWLMCLIGLDFGGFVLGVGFGFGLGFPGCFDLLVVWCNMVFVVFGVRWWLVALWFGGLVVG